MANKIGTWTSIGHHHYDKASCHPHCKDADQNGGIVEGDIHNFQETYPSVLFLANPSYVCFPDEDGSGANYCAFMADAHASIDPIEKIITFTFKHRSGPLTIQLTADLMDGP